MRPRTKIAIPEPKGSEFENFDRLASILMRVNTNKKKPKTKRKPSKAKV
jgi:hypothetical protein